MDSAVLVWNGNGVVGAEAIGKFISELPLTEHKLGSLDAQKILGEESCLLFCSFYVLVDGLYE